ncbi:MAG: hypothetical protein ACKO2Z_28780, partial [Sphaerospermopsis kisseleviana]
MDNAETILQSGVLSGQYQTGYEYYRSFFQALGQRQHNSCVILTTREKPQEISLMQGDTLPVRCLKLAGLSLAAGQQLLQLKGCFLESDVSWQKVIKQYSANPLALKIISVIAKDLYDGNISELLRSKSLVIGEINEVIEEQFNRLPLGEKNFLYWLTIQEDQDQVNLKLDIPGISPQNIIASIRSLLHRSLLEKKNRKLFLQPVVREYIQNKIIEIIIEEIQSEKIELLNQYPLLKSSAKEY